MSFWLNKNKRDHCEKKEQEYEYINLSNVILNTHEDTLLKKGPKFIINDSIDMKDTMPKYESIIEKLPEEERNGVRLEIQRELKKKMSENERDIEDRKALRVLRERKDIKICMTDKTGKIAIINNDDYRNMLEETVIKMGVEKLEKDPTRKIYEKVKKLIKEGKWPNDYRPTINNFAPMAPRCFGRIKDHKTPIKIRPIINKREGPTYPIELYMKAVYREILPESECALNSTRDFVKVLRDFKFEDGNTMVSFDIENMFPSINTSNLATYISELIDKKYKQSEIAVTLKSANHLILNNSYFKLDQTIYKQKNGLPMGSPVSSILAEMKLRQFEKAFVNNHPQIIKWNRYVDDIFAVLNKEEDVNEVLQDLNNTDPDLKFTIEKEVNGILNYLDIKIIKYNNIVNTTVYRKPTASQEIINHRCITPKQYKFSAITAYIDRAFNVCSNEELLFEEIEHIKDITIKAGYKLKTFNRIKEKRKNMFNNIPPGQKPKRNFTIPIPYNNGAGLLLKNKAKKFNLNVPIKPNRNIFKHIRNDKYPINTIDTAGIYSIPIKVKENNKQMEYIGVTKRRITERIKEHKKDIEMERCGTALAQYNINHDIEIDFDGVRKLANFLNHSYSYKREAAEIIGSKRAINQMEHAKIEPGWRRLLEPTRRQVRHSGVVERESVVG